MGRGIHATAVVLVVAVAVAAGCDSASDAPADPDPSVSLPPRPGDPDGGAPVGAAPGGTCVQASDCASKICDATKKCAAPTSTDGVMNGDESDVDCGGTTTGAPRCALGKGCKSNGDCQDDACSYKGVCVTIKSCTPHHGGDTCGPGEVDATHESCCTTIPGSPIEKYNITAGRFRQFVERTKGDMRGWAKESAPTGWNHDWDQFLPTTLDNGGNTPDDSPAFSGVYQELGPNVHGAAGGGNMGCFISGTGARTYRLPDDVNARMGDLQKYPQDVLDEKILNCVTAYMVAAFCFWDGGRLPTRAEWNAAWGTKTYPWGASPAPAGWPAAFPSDATGTTPTPAAGDVKRANYNYNYWVPATRDGTDYSLYITAPGRFPTGSSALGHADLAGSVFQIQAITGTTAQWSKSGSWQGHAIPFGEATHPAKSKYWATGGRCAR